MASKVSLLVISLLIAQSGAQTSLQDLINQVYNNVTPWHLQTTTPTFQPNPTKTTALSDVGANTYRSCGPEKQCVPRRLCVGGAISTSGENFINIRYNNNGCNYGELCCDIPNKRDEPVIPAVSKEQHDGCGWRNSNGVGFKITGDVNNETQFAEFPWMVAILRTESGGGETIYLYNCGGSLIAPNVVLTAAHCVYNRMAQQLLVRAGEWDTQNTDEILKHVDRPVKEIITHEKFHSGNLRNDVALLIVTEPFVWQENIRPICLPERNTNFDHSRCYATGWGKDKFGREGKYQVILKKIDLPVIPRDICQNQLRQTRLGLHFKLHESFLCAGGEKDKDTCKGDGGSPLVCPIQGVKDRYHQAGIVAWGIGCAKENVPGVYANVVHLRPWISDKLTARGILLWSLYVK